MFFLYSGFLLFVVLMLALDLGVFHRHAHTVGIREALIWSSVWIVLALLFSIFVYAGYEQQWLGLGTAVDPATGTVNSGFEALLKYLTGYIIEKSLSIDNIFVIAMIFSAFAVPSMYQHRVLFWGILGALVLRGIMIGAGAEVIARYHWVLYLFGVFLILTGIKMLVLRQEKDLRESRIVKWLTAILPIDMQTADGHFTVRKEGRTCLTSLGLTLLIVETFDLIFAVDSIPAIFAITSEPFLVFTSNVFAILGLRSLYFALAGMLGLFRYLKPALALILIIVGMKMIFAEWLKAVLGTAMSLWVLAVILAILALAVAASLLHVEKRDPL